MNRYRHNHMIRRRRSHSLSRIGRTVCIGIAIVLVIVLLMIVIQPEPQLMNSAEVATIQRRGILRVGVLLDAPGFSAHGEGLEVDLSRALAKRIFPNDDPDATLELIPVNRRTALAKLDRGDVDILFAQMDLTTANSSYVYTDAYVFDACKLLVPRGKEAMVLNDQRIGAIQKSAALQVLKAYCETENVSLVQETFASYPDMAAALTQGNIDGMVMPGFYADQYVSNAIVPHQTVLGSIPYAAVSTKENAALAQLADILLSQLQQDGTMEQLYQTHHISNAASQK